MSSSDPLALPPARQKESVKLFWNEAACGERAFAKGPSQAERLANQADARWLLEPYIEPFARFDTVRDIDFLEIGVGMGADHERFVCARPRRACGVDLTGRAISITQGRLDLAGLQSELQQADAENLPYPDNTFNVVYSWGVLHHTPDTPKAFREVARVLKPRGVARIMIYHKWSIVGLVLWLRYGLVRGLSLAEVYHRYVESPGTKAYSISEARLLCSQAGLLPISIRTQLSTGDLLEGVAGQRHQGALLQVARAIWPRWFIKAALSRFGLFMMIEAAKHS